MDHEEKIMAARKSQLQSDYDQALEDISSVLTTLTEAYTVSATREELADAMGEAIETLSDYSEEQEDDDDEDT
jgi:hypothetical protein